MLPEATITLRIAKWVCPIRSPAYSSWFTSVKENPSFVFWFILFWNITMDSRWWFVVKFNVFCSITVIFLLMLKLSQIWPIGVPLSWLLCPFDISLPVFEDFLAFWHSKILHILSISQTWSQLFLQGALVPLSAERYLESKIWGHMCSLLLGRASLLGLFSGQS